MKNNLLFLIWPQIPSNKFLRDQSGTACFSAGELKQNLRE